MRIIVQALVAPVFCCCSLPAAAQEHKPLPQREIIPGSELMTSGDNANYRMIGLACSGEGVDYHAKLEEFRTALGSELKEARQGDQEKKPPVGSSEQHSG